MNQCEPFRHLRIALVPPLWAKVAAGTSGGVEQAVFLLADALVDRGHTVTVFTSRDSETKAHLVSLCDYNMIEAMERGLAWEYEYYETSNIAAALTRSRSFDVVHMHVGAYAVPLGELVGIPVLHTLHNPLTADAIWQLERHADAHISAVSHRQIGQLPKGRRRPIKIIHNGCDFNAFEFSGERGRYLAFLGRMNQEKAPHLAIQVARQAGWPIVLAGIPLDDTERSYFEEAVAPYIDGRRVIHLGAVDHARKSALLKNAAALVFPIQWEEPFGLVMIEAMACGTPVLALRRGSVDEVVTPGVTGHFGETVADLMELLPLTLELDRMKVRQLAREQFHLERMVNEYIEVYRALVGGRSEVNRNAECAF